MHTQAHRELATSTPRRSEDSFASSTIKGWEALNRVAPAQAYTAGTELFRQGSAVQDVYFIDQGLVKLIRLEPDGREMIVGLRFPGWVIAAAAAIIQQSHLTTGITMCGCRLRRISSETFRDLLQRDAQFSWLVHRMHSHEVYDQVARLVQLGCASARHRLEQLLWQLIIALEPDGLKKETKLALPLKQWEIAELIAVTPAYLSRIYNELERAGVLRRRNGWLIIHDPQRLWRWE